MQVYVAIFEDRHAETQATVHATLETAMAECNEWVTPFVERHGGEFVPEITKNWLYYVHTDCDDGPSAWVTEQEVKTDV